MITAVHAANGQAAFGGGGGEIKQKRALRGTKAISPGLFVRNSPH